MANVVLEGSLTDTQGCSSKRKLDEWVLQVEQELMNDEEIIDRKLATIFHVPKPLRDSNKHYYTPSLVSIGPYHFGKPELSSMENHKSEAVRRVQLRVQKKFPELTIKSIVESDIMKMDKKTRACYDEEIPCSPIALSWMVTRDACFILEFLLNYISGFVEYKEEKVVSIKYNSIFDGCVKNPTWERIIDDLLLLENQIPLFIMKHLLEMEMGSNVAADEKLNDMMQKLLSVNLHVIFSWDAEQFNGKSCHLLEVLYLSMVGSKLESYYQEAASLEKSQLFSFYCSSISPAFLKNHADFIKTVFESILIYCCKPCSHLMKRDLDLSLPTASRVFEDKVVPQRRRPKLPSAVELKNAGVKLQPVILTNAIALGESVAPIRWIRFDENTATLYLPEIFIKQNSHSLIRNLIAMEVSTDKYDPSPITQFAKFMDELVDSQDDVAALKKKGIINNFLGSNEEVTQLFNSLTSGIVSQYWCKPIDDARIGLAKYQEKKHKILWSEFVAAYFSKPWLVAGSLGAIFLLLMTVLQVFCLFYSCNKSF
ncbi:hypothetical protein SUGI_0411380 [Cryptomeria japonica]|uniref:putative UPF0481 protein At3g02645 n=1 Tax=Cryptomeria japonica TaxID=3369 RepID=UPI002408B53E|nr:putative UPF0481 protein At3g02645 [Cryptomeria japonica]XP_057818285.2 putative UPF0481 protein At3g02645 [Cryptomeria japonica]GLJ21967.1 hypothetical protein SUGI_0411380 [Cryptomeria japonica]